MVKRNLLAVLVVAGLILSSGVAKADLTMMKSKFDVTFYGYVKSEVVYHSARGFIDNYLVFAYPDAEPYKAQNTLSFTMRQTRFGFNIVAPGPTEASKVLGNIEVDFYGKGGQQEQKAALQLRRAFLMLKYPKWSILAGQEWMLMSPLYPHVSNYPAQAGIGNLGYRMPQFRFTYGNVWRVALSAGEKVENDTTDADFDAGDNSAVPDMQLQLGYWGKNNLQVILSGHYGEEKYDEGPSSITHEFHDVTFESYSYNLSLNVPIGKKLALAGEFYYGANLDGGYTGNVANQGVGIDEDGDRVAARDIGGWIELMVKPANKWTIYLGYSEDNPNDDDIEGGVWTAPALTPSGGVTKNQAYYAHIMYDITDSLRVSLEEMQLRSEYKNDDVHGNDGVIWSTDLAFWFFF